MSTRPPVVSFRLLTEDSGQDAPAVLRAVVTQLLRAVDAQCQTQRLAFEPTPRTAARAMRGNLWKSTRVADQSDIIRLRQTIATHVARPGHYVLFHFDGDTTWTRRSEAMTPRQFDRLIRDKVRLALDALKVADVETALSRLICIAPYYSIESWLYQNTVVARRCCDGRSDCEQTRVLIEEWTADRGLLDEVMKPKQSTCLGSAHNLELTTGLPVAVVAAAGNSLAATLEALRQAPGLKEALAATYDFEVDPG